MRLFTKIFNSLLIKLTTFVIFLAIPSVTFAQGTFDCRCFNYDSNTYGCVDGWEAYNISCIDTAEPSVSQCDYACNSPIPGYCESLDGSNTAYVYGVACIDNPSPTIDHGDNCTIGESNCETGTSCRLDSLGVARCLRQPGEGACIDTAECSGTYQCVELNCSNVSVNLCGNTVCDSGETVGSCPGDCVCGNGSCDPGETYLTCATDCDNPTTELEYNFCAQAPDGDLRDQCIRCVASNAGSDATNIWTGVGCVSASNSSSMVSALLGLLVGMGGGLALVFILFGAFTVATSTSNPERLKTGKEMLVSAVGGLLFIIFSVILLKFIGVDLLKLPGFGSSTYNRVVCGGTTCAPCQYCSATNTCAGSACRR